MAWAFLGGGLCGDHVLILDVSGIPYGLFSILHLSKLKRIRVFLERSKTELMVEEGGRFNFDGALLPEESWEGDLDKGEFEVR